MRGRFWRYLIALIFLSLPAQSIAQEIRIKASDNNIYTVNIDLTTRGIASTLESGIRDDTGQKIKLPPQIAAEILAGAQELQAASVRDFDVQTKTIRKLNRTAKSAVVINTSSSLLLEMAESKLVGTVTGKLGEIPSATTSATEKALNTAKEIAKYGGDVIADYLVAKRIDKLTDSAEGNLNHAAVYKRKIFEKIEKNDPIEISQIKEMAKNINSSDNQVVLAAKFSQDNLKTQKEIWLKPVNDLVTKFGISAIKANSIDGEITDSLNGVQSVATKINYLLESTEYDVADIIGAVSEFNKKISNVDKRFTNVTENTSQKTSSFSEAALNGFASLALSSDLTIPDPNSQKQGKPPQSTVDKDKTDGHDIVFGKAKAELAEAQRHADEAAQKKAKADSQAAALQKDLDMMGGEMSSLASKLAKAGNKASLESALEKSKKEYDDSRSRQRMLSRQVSIYKEALKQLTGTIKTYEVTINGQVFRPEDVPTLKQRIAEQSAILTQLEKTFSNRGGLKDQYDAARERLNALKQLEKQQADAKVKLAETEAAIAQALADAHAAEEVLKNNQALVAERQATIKATPQDTLSIDQPAAWQPPFDSNETPSTSSSLPSNSPSPQTSIDNYADELREDDFVALTSTSTTTIGAASNSGVGGSVIADDSSSNILAVTFLAGKFRETPLRVNSEYYDIDEIVTAIFGGNYRVADWTEIIPYLIGNANDFIDQWVSGKGTLKNFSSPLLPLTNSSSPPENYRSPMITKQGSLSLGRISSDGDTFNRQYFVDYRDSVGLEAVQTDSNFFSLSAWQTTSSILAIKTNSDPEPAINTAAGPSTYQEWMGFCPYLRVSPSDNGTALANIILGLNPATRTVSHNFAGAGGASTVTDSFYYGKDLLGVAYTSWITGQAGWLVNGADAVATGTFNYLTWGTWNENASYNAATDTIVKVNTLAMPWVAGQLTPSNEIPISGSATYNGSVIGAVGQIGDASSVQRVAGNLTLQADFASQVLSGQFNTMHLQNGDPWKDFNVNASWASGANSINGTITSTDNSTNGTMGGKFYGPNAAELGGAWSSDNGTGELATGIFVGKKQ